MPEPRMVVRTLKEYHPPLGGRRGLRMDFNENTSGCSPRVLEKLRTLDGDLLSRYPEREPVERLTADFLGLGAPQVVLTNGVDEGIHLLAETYLEPGDEALIVVPTFSMYEIYALATGASVAAVQAGKNFRFPTAAVLACITPQTKLIAIANPNNPTGQVVSREHITDILAAAPQAAVLIDEAYYDFYGETMVGEIANFENLFVARTFSKAHGLAGFRVGILAGPAEQMKFVRRVSSPYNVNGIALACLPEALADRDYISNYVAEVKRGRLALETELTSRGIKFWPSHANFILTYFGDHGVPFVEAMRARGILVRDRHRDPGCAGCVRITLGTEEQTDKLIAATRNALTDINYEPQSREART